MNMHQQTTIMFITEWQAGITATHHDKYSITNALNVSSLTNWTLEWIKMMMMKRTNT